MARRTLYLALALVSYVIAVGSTLFPGLVERQKLIELIFFTVPAILLAVIQYNHSRELINHSKQLVEQIPTRFLGRFPECVRGVADVVESAQKSLDIMCDHCGYGHFSDQEQFARYFVAIQRKRRIDNVEVRMMTYDGNLEQKSRRTQFVGGFDDFRLKNLAKFNSFFPKEETRPRSWQQFEEELLAKQCDYRDVLNKSEVDMRTLTHEVLVFLWIADRTREAAFSFRTKDDGGDREVAFTTKDPQLINTLSEVFNKTWAKATSEHASGIGVS